MLHRSILAALALCLGMMLTACQPEEPGPRPPVIEIVAPSPTAPGVTPTADAGEAPVRGPASATTTAVPQSGLVQGLAYVDAVTVIVDPGAGAATLRVVGNLADGCTQLADNEQLWEDGQLRVTLHTSRDPDLLCSQALVPFDTLLTVNLPAAVTALAAGTLSVTVNGVAASADGVPAVSTGGDGCGVVTPGLLLYGSGQATFCFLYPEGYLLFEPTTNIVSVSAPERYDGSAERVMLAATFDRAAVSDMAQVEASVRASLPGADSTVTQGTLAGFPALFVQNPPAIVGNRQAFFLAHGMIYTLTVQPIDPALPDSTAAAEALWRTVVDSFALAMAVE